MNKNWWSRPDSNRWPRECDPRALPTELRPHKKKCVKLGAGGRSRTDMVSPPRDFESRASAYFATPALNTANITADIYMEENTRELSEAQVNLITCLS